MYVYILRSQLTADRYYVGITDDLKNRITIHNAGLSVHTSKFKPWQIKLAIWFRDKNRAFLFERYLKTQSGRSFTKKHF